MQAPLYKLQIIFLILEKKLENYKNYKINFYEFRKNHIITQDFKLSIKIKDKNFVTQLDNKFDIL